MDTSTFSLQVSATEPALNILIRLNDLEVYRGCPGTTPTTVTHEFDDSDNDYTLTIQLSGKTVDHTTVDSDGNIVKDVLVSFSDFKLEGIDISQIVFDKAEYHHDFNGSQESTVDTFQGTIGCNGTVFFKFQAPVYLWLLENM